MLTSIHPKLPMRDLDATKTFYLKKLGFTESGDYGHYLIVKKDHVEIHFFEHKNLDPETNYGQVYIRTAEIDAIYNEIKGCGVDIHPNGALEIKPWGQREFSLLDPDNNLITFGQALR